MQATEWKPQCKASDTFLEIIGQGDPRKSPQQHRLLPLPLITNYIVRPCCWNTTHLSFKTEKSILNCPEDSLVSRFYSSGSFHVGCWARKYINDVTQFSTLHTTKLTYQARLTHWCNSGLIVMRLLVSFWSNFLQKGYFYILTTVSCPSSSPTSCLPIALCPVHTPYTSPPFLFRKGKATREYQPNMAYQVPERLGTSPCIKAEWGNGSQQKSQRQPQLP